MVVYSVYADNLLIHHSESSSPEVKLINPKLSMEENSSGSFSCTIPPSNVGYDYVTRLTTEIIVKRQTIDSQTGLLGVEKEIWSGRVIDEKTDFYNNRQITCEGALSYLNDTIQPQAKYENYTPENMLRTLLNNHNDRKSPYAKNGITIKFDYRCKTENNCDNIYIYYRRESSSYYNYIKITGEFGDKEINIPSADFYLYWHTDSSIHNYYGYKIESIVPYVGSEYTPIYSYTPSLPAYPVINVTLNNLPESAHDPYQDNTNELYLIQTGFNRGFDQDIKLGAVTVHDPDTQVGSTTYETNFESTMDCVNNKLLNTCGGHLVLRRNASDGYNYVDYLEEYSNLNNQKIEFGKNLLDFSKSFDVSSICTVLIPLGERLEGEVDDDMDSYLTVESVNSGSMYVVNQDAVNNFGWIEKCVHFDDVEDASILLRKAQRYLQDTQFEQLTLELTAVDMHYLGVDEGQLFELYDNVRCISKPHGLDRTFPIKKVEIPLDNPQNTTFTIGDNTVANTLSSTLTASNTMINSKIDALPSTTSVLKEAKANADQLMRQLSNGYITTIIEGTEENAHSEAQVISNAQHLYEDANKFWIWNINGLAHYTGTWAQYKAGIGQLDTAITMDGTIVANRILTGTLGKPEWGNYWNMETGDFVLSPGKVTAVKVYKWMRVRFDSQSYSESASCDWVDVVWKNKNGTYSYVRRGGNYWGSVDIDEIYDGELYIYWRTDSSVSGYKGFRVNEIGSSGTTSYTTPTGTRSTPWHDGDTVSDQYKFNCYASNAYANVHTDNFPNATQYTNNERKLWTINIDTVNPVNETLDTYTQDKVDTLDNSLNQQSVFNRLTNNGQEQGIYMHKGKLYLNGEYIKAKTVSADLLQGGTITGTNPNGTANGMTIDLNNGTITTKKLVVNASNFELDSDGNMSCTSASLDSATITDASISNGTIDNVSITNANISSATLTNITATNATIKGSIQTGDYGDHVKIDSNAVYGLYDSGERSRIEFNGYTYGAVSGSLIKMIANSIGIKGRILVESQNGGEEFTTSCWSDQVMMYEGTTIRITSMHDDGRASYWYSDSHNRSVWNGIVV